MRKFSNASTEADLKMAIGWITGPAFFSTSQLRTALCTDQPSSHTQQQTRTCTHKQQEADILFAHEVADALVEALQQKPTSALIPWDEPSLIDQIRDKSNEQALNAGLLHKAYSDRIKYLKRVFAPIAPRLPDFLNSCIETLLDHRGQEDTHQERKARGARLFNRIVAGLIPHLGANEFRMYSCFQGGWGTPVRCS